VLHRLGRFLTSNLRTDYLEAGKTHGPGSWAPETRVEALAKLEAGALIFVERVELPPYPYAVTFERVASRS